MKYYRLYDDIKFPNRWYLGDISTDDNWQFVKGRSYKKESNNSLNVEIDTKGTAMDYTETSGEAVPIISQNCANCLSDFLDDIQFVPVIIKDTKVFYTILVAKNSINCIDEANSDFEVFKEGNKIRPDLVGKYQMINKLRVDIKKINKNIFRLKNYEIALVVSEKVKQSFEKTGITGVVFELVS